MAISLDKIVQMQQQSGENWGQMRNPFEKWLKMKSNLTTSYNNYMKDGQLDSYHIDAESVELNDRVEGNLIVSAERETNKFLHLAVSSPLIFLAFITICVTLLILFERQSRKSQQDKQRFQGSIYSSSGLDGTTEILVCKSEPDLTSVSSSTAHISNIICHQQLRNKNLGEAGYPAKVDNELP